MTVPKRFGVLRLFGTILKVLAWILLVLAVLGAIGAVIIGAGVAVIPDDVLPDNMSLVTLGGGITAGIGALLIGMIYFVIFYALGELLHMYLALEENTRLTAALLLKMHQDGQVEETPTYSTGVALWENRLKGSAYPPRGEVYRVRSQIATHLFDWR
ncbi:MAG: hypothetical protein HC802_02340 [Caldilineaceae bacterium]|nr:hypothetical protein [Caldilineaceae bacterium]